MCAMTSRPYGWGLRNIAKSDRETANCELFSFFYQKHESNEIFYSHLKHIEVLSKTPYDSNENFYRHFTLCGDLCVQCY